MTDKIYLVADLIKLWEENFKPRTREESHLQELLVRKYKRMLSDGITEIPGSIQLEYGGHPKPWTLPWYRGKLKETISLNPLDHPEQEIEDLIELTIQMMLDEEITEEMASRLLKRYDKAKKDRDNQ